MRRYRSLFLSDVHLGTRECKAERLLAFLANMEADYIYLVGDIVDGWRLLSSWHWPHSHTEVIVELVARAQKCRVAYLPGNHDDFIRHWAGTTVGGIRFDTRLEHVAADGSVYLVTHGDHVDRIYSRLPRLAHLLSWIEGIINNTMGGERLTLWSRLKKFYRMRRHISQFEAMMIDGLEVTGVICGHIHHPAINKGAITYINCGDWIEHCTAVVEHHDGRLEIVTG
jgi:UDP-2,3-diacylglucosamine pyrophosphatase LpxH